MTKYKYWILLIICNLFWAGNYVIGKYVVAEMTPLWITFSRWTFASIMLIGIAHYLEKPDWKTVIKAWPKLLGLSLLGIVGYNLVLYSALDYTSSTNAAFVSALNPAMMVLFSVILLRDKISRLQILGISISLIGALVILTRGNVGQVLHTSYNKGDLLMLAAIVLWTLYSITGKRIMNIPPITTTAASAFIAAVIMAPFAMHQGIDIGKLSPLTISGILYITIFPSICSFIFWNISVREIGASKAGIFLNLIPVFTAIISWILGEKITLPQILGGLLVFIGVCFTTGMIDKGNVSKIETGV
jgi:drug/metabolite transporter (DMT)-like permease